jgi:hypothetical protein
MKRAEVVSCCSMLASPLETAPQLAGDHGSNYNRFRFNFKLNNLVHTAGSKQKTNKKWLTRKPPP